MDRPVASPDPIAVIIPVLNDWESLRRLLRDLSKALDDRRNRIHILIVDDGSEQHARDALPVDGLGFGRIECLLLRRNLGHQRAIAVGLSWLLAEVPDFRGVVVMDGDGEDRPEDVPRLIDACAAGNFRQMVFAERSKRSEGLPFRMGYGLFRALHRLLTGKKMRVGNFSIIPRESVESLVTVSELWNHYPAAADKSRQRRISIPAPRGVRYAGRSRLNWESLVIHGLSAISVHADVVGVRAITLSLILLGLTVLTGLGVALIRLFTDLGIPGWATTAGGLLLVLFVQFCSLGAFFSFITLSNRQGTTVIPARDFAYFVAGVDDLTALQIPSSPSAASPSRPLVPGGERT